MGLFSGLSGSGRNLNKKGNGNMNNNSVANNNKFNEGVNGMKNNKEVRMEKLQAAGVNTDKYFNINLANIPVDAPVKITINGVEYNLSPSNINPEQVHEFNNAPWINDEDQVASQIIEDGYVRNTKLHRRWVMAQTFNMLNSSSYNHKTHNYEKGWDAYVRNNLSYMYQFEMTLEELKVLSKLEDRDHETFEERRNFFTREVVVELCNSYLRQLRKYINNQKVRTCHGEPYVKLSKYGNVFVKDLNSKVYNPLQAALTSVNVCRNYTELYNAFSLFVSLISKLPNKTAKCPQWKDAFKGSGAFYTLKNMIMFHGITFEERDRDESLMDLDDRLFDYKGDYWKFHMLLKQVIADNNFNFQQSIELHKAN